LLRVGHVSTLDDWLISPANGNQRWDGLQEPIDRQYAVVIFRGRARWQDPEGKGFCVGIADLMDKQLPLIDKEDP
jgi:hypothetical protein